MLRYLFGKIDLNSYDLFCVDNNLDPLKSVFLFPGNAGHHRQERNLFSIKDGGGLAHVAMLLGRAGYATLSLPTTGMDCWKRSEMGQKIVNVAIADLWFAVGRGFSLVLPVREHFNEQYFSRCLPDSDYEPSLWGGIQSAANLSLADFYLSQLELIYQFKNLSNSEALQSLQVDHFDYYQAYLAGESDD